MTRGGELADMCDLTMKKTTERKLCNKKKTNLPSKETTIQSKDTGVLFKEITSTFSYLFYAHLPIVGCLHDCTNLPWHQASFSTHACMNTAQGRCSRRENKPAIRQYST